VVDEHQGRLDSINSCRCGDRSRLETRGEEGEDARSELSYAEPEVTQDASNFTPSSTIPPPTPLRRAEVLEILPSIPELPPVSPLREDEVVNVPSQEWLQEGERMRREAMVPGSPMTQMSESFFNTPEVRVVDSPASSGRLVEIISEGGEDRAEDSPQVGGLLICAS
jgi:hypothetical protein